MRTTGAGVAGVAAVLCVGGAPLLARSARAEPNDADRVLATELFQEGRALLAQKRFAEACPKLEESNRLDPGGGTLLNLALCHELAGRTATAWSEFGEAIARARKDGREDRELAAQRHLQALEPRLSRLVIAVPEAARRPGLGVRRDGLAIAAVAWNAAIPVDPGTHAIEASAPGFLTWRSAVEVAAGGVRVSVSVPELEPEPAPRAVDRTPERVRRAELGAQRALTQPARSQPAPAAWQRPLALGAGGLGLAGLALGGLFAVEARQEWADAKPHCPANACDDTGYAAWRSARDHASLATFAVVGGAAVVAASAVLWISAPAGRSVGASASLGQIALHAEF